MNWTITYSCLALENRLTLVAFQLLKFVAFCFCSKNHLSNLTKFSLSFFTYSRSLSNRADTFTHAL